VKALLFGASGGLATEIGRQGLAAGWHMDFVTRSGGQAGNVFAAALASGQARLFIASQGYAGFELAEAHDAVFFTQALFAPRPLAETPVGRIVEEINVGLSEIIASTAALLARYPPVAGQRRDFCYIGSTSSYAGFRNTAVYCAVKHGLLGFIRAMNDEYAQTDTRFWLFSMGTMDTEMGAKVTGQDAASYLKPADVAARIIAAIAERSNIFEPEVILRRRTIRLLGG